VNTFIKVKSALSLRRSLRLKQSAFVRWHFVLIIHFKLNIVSTTPTLRLPWSKTLSQWPSHGTLFIYSSFFHISSFVFC